ncbi:MAG TPA: hypothetical protein DIV86_01545 [Alphaproteobacteria bacterium]|nr:hypothetical protein [Alphaproteobacteria bacterium]
MKGIVAGFLGGAFIGNIVKSADHIYDLSQRLNIGAGILSQYNHIADMTGTSIESFGKGFKTLAKNVADAADGTGKAKDSFKELGLDAAKLKELSIDEQFQLVAEAMKNVTNDTDRVRIATEIFGKAGMDLIPVLNEGAEGIIRLKNEANNLGVTMTDAQASGIASMKDSLDKLWGVIVGVGRSIIAHFAPAVEWAADFLSDIIPKAVDIARKAFDGLIIFFLKIYQNIVERIASLVEKISKLPGLISDAFDYASGLPLIGDSFKSAAESAGNLEQRIKSVSDGLRGHVEVLNHLKSENTSFVESNKVATKSFDDFKKVVDETALAGGAIKRTTEEQKLATEGLNQLQNEAKSLIESNKTAYQKYTDSVKKADQMLKAKLITQDTYNSAIGKFREELNQTDTALQSTGDFINDILGGAINGNIKSWKDLGNVAVKSLQGILTNLLKFDANKMGTGGSLFPNMSNFMNSDFLGSIFGGKGKSSGLSSLFGSVTSMFSSGKGASGFSSILGSVSKFLPSFAGFFAEGGTIPRGKFGIVGERGPELAFAGNGNLNISPFDSKSSGETSATNITYNIDARGADPSVVERIESALNRVNKSIESRALKAVQDTRNRNPSFA